MFDSLDIDQDQYYEIDQSQILQENFPVTKKQKANSSAYSLDRHTIFGVNINSTGASFTSSI